MMSSEPSVWSSAFYVTVLPSQGEALSGDRFTWLRHVTGFNQNHHCAACLKGTRHPDIERHQPRGTIKINALYGSIWYFCVVCDGNNYEGNRHLAFRVPQEGSGDTALLFLASGDVVEFEGVEKIEFDDQAARSWFPHYGDEFLTCRNFQFGAQHFMGARS